MSNSTARLLLLVDDDERFRERLHKAIAARGYEVQSAPDHDRAMSVARERHIDRAVVDLRMPGSGGLALVRDLIQLQPDVAIVVLTGYGSIATAVEALKLGATDYLTKPADAGDLLRAFGLAPELGGAGGSTATAQAERETGAGEVPSLARVEWEHISRVVADCGGNISRAARLLRMQRRSLQRKLAKYPVSK
jgi:two-component system response regulator RegA